MLKMPLRSADSCRHVRFALGAMLTISTPLLTACGGGKLEERLSKVEKQYAELQSSVEVWQDGAAPHFSLSPVKIEIQEKMFEPLLEGMVDVALLDAAKTLPIYVDVVVDIQDHESNFSVQKRYRLTFGHDVQTLKFSQSLPRHGMNTDSLMVTVTPFSWYRANPIAPEQVVPMSNNGHINVAVIAH